MNKNLTWIVLGVIVVALAIWYFTRPAGTGNLAVNNTAETSTSATTSKSSIKSLLAAGRPVSCTYNNSTEGSGTVYVASQKMRADYTAQGSTGHMINDGQFLYIWTDGMAQGFKMDATTAGDDTNPKNTSAPDITTEQDYSCKAWTPTSASFVPPTNVTFSALPGSQ